MAEISVLRWRRAVLFIFDTLHLEWRHFGFYPDLLLGKLAAGAGAVTVYQVSEARGFASPSCKTARPVGKYWLFGSWRKAFDTFLGVAACSHCSRPSARKSPFGVGSANPISDWMAVRKSATTVSPSKLLSLDSDQGGHEARTLTEPGWLSVRA